MRSLAVGMIQAGAKAVLAPLWEVNDMATFLLMARFAQEWLPRKDSEPPAAALARAQHWLRTVTHRDLQTWCATSFPTQTIEEQSISVQQENRPDMVGNAESLVHRIAKSCKEPDVCPYADPIDWAGFQITGW